MVTNCPKCGIQITKEEVMSTLCAGCNELERNKLQDLRIKTLEENVESLLNLIQKLKQGGVRNQMIVVGGKDVYTRDHGRFVANLSVLIAFYLNIKGQRLVTLETAALYHDIGKAAVPERLLQKPGKLTLEEDAIVRSHVDKGVEILLNLDMPTDVINIVQLHHERWDGLGYKRFSGEEIPVESRVIAIADAIHSMLEDRAYRAKSDKARIIRELKHNIGKQFDPLIAQIVLDNYDSIVETSKNAPV